LTHVQIWGCAVLMVVVPTAIIVKACRAEYREEGSYWTHLFIGVGVYILGIVAGACLSIS
jgi:hypothetical protein